mgnify:CR=1 FL=1
MKHLLTKNILEIDLEKKTYHIRSRSDLDDIIGGVGLSLKLYSEFIDLDNAKTNYYLHYFHMRFNLKNQIKNNFYFILWNLLNIHYFF